MLGAGQGWILVWTVLFTGTKVSRLASVFYEKYGIHLNKAVNPLELELLCFKVDWHQNGGLGAAGHFKNAARMLWPTPEDCGEKRGKPFYWHPWAERGLDVLCRYQYPALSGCASSGKSELGAIWAIINWLAAPAETIVLVTSTSLKDSRKRIWGSIVEHFQACPALPGKLIDSEGIIRTVGADGKLSDRCGISLVAGDKRKARDAVGYIIGIKAKRVILIADELPELSPSLLEAALTNLVSNPYFQLVALGNFASVYDPFGEFTAPRDGWDSVTVNDEEWETKLGYCLRFDGLKSPNILAGRDEWPFLYNSKTLSKHRSDLGEKTGGFWRFCRSFPAPEGFENTIYTEADLLMGGAYQSDVKWLTMPVKVAGFDPSYTSGGDRPMLKLGEYGINTDGKAIIALRKTVVVREDVMLKAVPRSYQIARDVIRHCTEFGVQKRYFGCDTTSGGSVFGDIFDAEWKENGRIHRTTFGGMPSELHISTGERTTAREKYVNKVTELWNIGRSFVRAGQIRGVTFDLARELKSRTYELTKGSSVKERAEEKKEMKERLGYSPDDGDAFVILLDVCRHRLGAKPASVDGKPIVKHTDWQQAVREANRVYRRADYSHEPPKETLYATK